MKPRRNGSSRPGARREGARISSRLRAFIEGLSHADWLVRESNLEQLRKDGASAVSALARALSSTRQIRIRAGILEALARIGPLSQPALGEVHAALDDEHWAIRLRAVQTLIEVQVEPRALTAELLQRLDDAHPAVRQAVVKGLGRLRPTGPAIETLIASFLDEDLGVRHTTAALLRELGAAAVPPLAQALSSPQPRLVQRVAWTLGRIGAPAEPAIPRLAALLNGDRDSRDAGAEALGRIGAAAIPALLAALEAVEPSPRQGAALALTAMAQHAPSPRLAEAVPGLIIALQDAELAAHAAGALEACGQVAIPNLIALVPLEGDPVQGRAIAILGNMGPRALSAVPALLQALTSPVGAVREDAGVALSAVGLDAVPQLVAALERPEDEVVREAARALGLMAGTAPRLPPPIARAIPALVAAIERPGARNTVARALGAMGKPVVAPLLSLLEGGGERQRYILWTLGQIGPAAAEALPAFLELARDKPAGLGPLLLETIARIGGESIPTLIDALEEPALEGTVVEALERIGGPAVPEILRRLKKRDRRASPTLIRLLAWIAEQIEGPIPESILSAFRSALKHTDAAMRQAALEAFGGLAHGRHGDPVSEILPRLRDEDALVRERCLAVLGGFGEAAVQALILALGGDPPGLRSEASRALATIGAPAIPALIEALDAPDSVLRRRAACSLGRLGQLHPEAAVAAVPALVAALEDDHVRCAACYALGQIAEPGAAALPALIDILQHPEEESRWWAAYACEERARRSRSEAAAAAPALIDRLESDEPEVQRRAAAALGALGGAAQIAAQALGKAAARGIDDAVFALRAMGAGDREQVLFLAEVCESDDRLTRELGARVASIQKLSARGRSFEGLLEAAAHQDPVTRRLAMRGLGALGRGARSATPQLVARLRDPDFLVRHHAAWAFTQIGREAFDDLRQAYQPEEEMRKEDAATRELIVFTIGAIGRLHRPRKKSRDASRRLLPFLLDIIEDSPESALVRPLAIRALAGVGAERRRIRGVLIDLLADPRLRGEAAWALERLGGESLRPLFEALEDPARKVGARRALRGLARRAGAAELAPLLNEALASDNEDLRWTAASLIALASEDEASDELHRLVPELTAAARKASSESRLAAIEALGGLRLTEDAEEVVPVYLEALSDENHAVRRAASEALIGVAAGDPRALSGLGARIEDGDTVMRQRAAWAFSELSEEDEGGGPLRDELRKLLEDRSALVRVAAVRGLRERPSTEAALALHRRLADSDLEVRWEAAWGLWEVAPEVAPVMVSALNHEPHDPSLPGAVAALGPRAIEELTKRLGRPDPAGRLVETLGLIGAPAVEPLLAALKIEDGLEDSVGDGLGDGVEDRRRNAIEALGRVGLAAAPRLIAAFADPRHRMAAAEALSGMSPAVTPALLEALGDTRSGVRGGAALALGYLKSRRKSLGYEARAVEALRGALQDAVPRVRAQAARALGRFGATAAAAIPSLVQGLEDNPPAAREESARALGAIAEAKRFSEEESRAAIPALIEALSDRHAGLREAAIEGLSALGEPAIPALEEGASSPRARLRASAARALGAVARRLLQRAALRDDPSKGAALSAAVVAALGPLLADSERAVCRVAIAAIGAFPGGLTAAREALRAAFREAEPKRAAVILETLKALPAARSTLSELLAEAKDRRLRLAALDAIAASEPEKAEAPAPALRQALDDEDPAVAARAAEVLAVLGSVDAEALAGLRAALERPEAAVRAAALRALSALDGGGVKLDSARLQELVGAEETGLRLAAARLLHRIEDADPALGLVLLRDPEPSVVAAAARSLGFLDLTGEAVDEADEALSEAEPEARAAWLRSLAALARRATDEALGDRCRLLVLEGLESEERTERQSALTAFEAEPPSFIDARQRERFVQALAELLEDAEESRGAIAALGRLERAEEGLVEVLVRGAERPELTGPSLRALGRLSFESRGLAELAAEAVRAGLDGEAAVREEAILCLAATGRRLGAEELLALLDQGASDPSAAVRLQAARAWEALELATESAIDRLSDLLADPDPRVRLAAAASIGSLAQGQARVFPRLIEKLVDHDEGVREAASRSLSWLSRETPSLVELLLTSLRDDRPLMRQMAAETLGELPEFSPGMVGRLADALRDRQGMVREAAVRALREQGRRATSAAAALIEAFAREKHRPIREQMIQAFEAMGDGAEAAVPGLLAALEDSALRGAIVRALGAIGAGARVAVPRLLRVFDDPDRKLHKEAERSLARIGAPSLGDLPEVLDLLSKGGAEASSKAAEAIGSLGAAGRSAAPAILKAIPKRAKRFRISAARALEAIGGVDEDGAAELADLLGTLDDEARLLALEVLERSGRTARGAVPAIAAVLSSPRLGERACRVLGELGEASEEAVPSLIASLEHPEASRRQLVCRTLGQIGPAAAAAAEALKEALEGDPNEGVRMSAEAALAKIQSRS